MARTTLNGIQNKLSMHKAAKLALSNLNKESTYMEIYQYIIDNKLFEFGAKKEPPEQILKKILERKCINAKSSTKTKEELFYKKGKNTFGLIEWLSTEDTKTTKKIEKKINNLDKTKSYSVKFSMQSLAVPLLILSIFLILLEVKKFLYIGTPILIILVTSALILISIISYEKFTGNKVKCNLDNIGKLMFLSGAWLFFILIIASSQKFGSMDLNNWGDFLAGFFTPLLFLWLVYGVFIQKQEFANALESFQKQHKEMKDQVIQVEIQQLNTWFYRNTSTINMLKKDILNNNINSIQQLFINLENDISEHYNYFETYDELKNLIDLDMYVNNYLDIMRYKNKERNSLIESIENIKVEYNVLFADDINFAKKILTLVYFFIFSSRTRDDFSKYKIYEDWIEEEENYQNLLIAFNQGELFKTLQVIMTNYKKLKIDFEKGRINGSI